MRRRLSAVCCRLGRRPGARARPGRALPRRTRTIVGSTRSVCPRLAAHGRVSLGQGDVRSPCTRAGYSAGSFCLDLFLGRPAPTSETVSEVPMAYRSPVGQTRHRLPERSRPLLCCERYSVASPPCGSPLASSRYRQGEQAELHGGGTPGIGRSALQGLLRGVARARRPGADRALRRPDVCGARQRRAGHDRARAVNSSSVS